MVHDEIALRPNVCVVGWTEKRERVVREMTADRETQRQTRSNTHSLTHTERERDPTIVSGSEK